ncbi:MAG: amino acid adenylation domain-containing protein [Acidobacteriota bacterium]
MEIRQSGASILPSFLRLRAQEEPERWAYAFLEDGEREAGRLTYAGLDRQARAVAVALAACCAPGDRALLLLPPGLEFVAAFFGCLYAGVVAVPAYPPTSARRMPRLGTIVEDCAPRAVLAASSLPRLRAWAEADPRLAALPWIEPGRLAPLAPDTADGWRDPGIGPDDLAFLQYTSGSTSAPKGVRVSHGNLMANEALIRDACGHSRDSVFVTWLPLYHDLGLIGNVLQAVYVGAPCVMMAPAAFLSRPLRWLEAVSKYGGTTSGGPNFAYDLCAARAEQGADLAGLDLSSWRIAFNGAEPVRAGTLDRFAAAFRGHGFHAASHYPCYGLAEATLMVTGGAPAEPPAVRRFDPGELERGRAVEADGDEAARALVSSGRPLGGQDVRVVDPESGLEVEPGRVGEVWVSGPSVADGYWGRPEETAEAFGGRLATGEGPFLRTGDLGFFDDGELFVAGRVKDLIILRGRNLYPQDLELAAERCDPGLRPGGGAAFSIDEDGEERLVLVLELERQVRARDTERLAGIAAAVRRAIAEEHEAQVHEVVLTGPGGVPRTTSGKVQRRACRALYLEGALEAIGRSRLERAAEEPAGEAEDGDVEGWLRRLVAARTGAGSSAAIDPGQPLTACGLDSLAAIEVAGAVQARFGAVLPIGDLLGGMTLAGALERILEAPAPAGIRPERLPAPETGEHTPTWGQRGLWFLHRMAPESPAYNLAGAATLALPVDAAALERALQALVDRHAVLRATWAGGAAGPVMRVAERAPVSFVRRDASGWSDGELRGALAGEAFRPFDLELGPVFRAALFERAEGSALVLAIHHIAADFASLAVLARELGELYSRFATGPETGLPEPELRFVDFAGWEERRLAAEGERLWDYWRERLAGVPALDPAPDRPRRPGFDDGGAAVAARLPVGSFGQVRTLAREHGCTPFMVLAAAVTALLGRRSGQEDFLLGAPSSGRGSERFDGVVGYFVNPLPLRADLSGDPSVAVCLERTRRALLDAFAHELPFALITERLRPDRDPGRPQLLQAMLAYQKPPEGLEGLAGFALGEEGAELALGRLALRSVALPNPAAQIDLLWTAARRGDELGIALQIGTALFDPATAERMLGHLGCLLAGMAADPERRLWEIPLLAPEERLQLLADEAGDAAAVSRDRGLHELFEEQALRSPDVRAVIGEDGGLTYGELARRSRALARRLRRLGVGPEARVAVCLRRTPLLVEALLAVLRAGGAYVPVDPAYPRERQAFLLADSAAGVLLTEEALVPHLPPFGGARVLLEEEAPEAPDGPEERGWIHPDQLAYLIYTSGSTGLPKGVAIRHSAAVARVAWAVSAYPAEQLRGVLASTSVCFDLSVFELFVPLAAGGAVVMAADALALPGLPAACEVTLVNTVPSAMAALVRAGVVPSSVRAVNLAGEPLRGELAARIHGLPGIEAVHNLYGPSEDTTYSTGSSVPRRADGEPTIGRPLPGTRARVFDRGLEPVPAGVPGQLWLGGAGLARGYFGRPDLTADRFRPDPVGETPGGRLYRTGDLARRRGDGELEFLGRIDHQVKVRGFRVELGEIEAALLGHPGVADAVATARGEGQDRRLVAYVERQTEGLNPEDLSSFLAGRLPGFMVPSAWVLLDALPRTPNGKVDRRALPEPDAAPRAEGYAAPRTALEERLAGMWAGLLGAERVGIHDNFFALGGHSLLAARVVSRLRGELGVELPLRAVFERPTVAALAATLEDRPDLASPPMVPAAPGEPPVLSFSQERLWILERLEAGTSAYNMPLALRLRGGFDPRAFAVAWNEAIRRHEVLRTAFPEMPEGPIPAVSDGPDGPLPLADLSGLDAEAREAEARRLAAREALRPFDLRTGPVLRALLLRLEEGEHRLVAALHHVAGDAWSLGVLVREINALYVAALEDRPSPLPELPLQYADFARWQRGWLRGGVLEAHLRWWTERLRGLPPALELPAARPRGVERRGAVAMVRIDPELSERLRGLARRAGATPFMALLAGFEAVLARYTGQTDLCVGIPVAGRNRLETEGLLGVFLNTLALRSDLSGDPAFGEVLARVRESSLEALAHQDLPFELLLEALRPERSLDRAPLFQVLFNLANVPAARFELPGVEVEELELPPLEPKLDLTVYAGEAGDDFELRLHYDASRFDAAQMEVLSGHLAAFLAAAAEEDGRRLSEVHLLPPSAAVARTAPAEPWAEGSIPERFAAVVRARAERPAVVDGDRIWTYAELDRVSDQGAAALGDGEGRVALLFAQGARRIAGLLAALKAGRTCVPLDPSYPRARLAFMVEDAEAGAVLTDEAHRELALELAGGGARLAVLDEEGDGRPVLRAVPPERPAYILYTSGSTGVPKGVVQSHGNVLHHIKTYADALGLHHGDRLTLLASYAFDAAVMDIFGALLTGAALCPFDVLDEGTAGLPDWVAERGVTVFHSTPTLYRRFLDEAGEARFPDVRLVVLGGEKSVRQDFERFRLCFGPEAVFVNGLGPTESTLALQFFASPESGIGRDTVPVGRPVEGTGVRLLNAAGEQAALYGVGEIALRSRYLAHGYWRRPELTEAAFLPDPEGGDRRIYRTGDLGRWLPDGSLEFVGRSDSQVKIRGQRVELGEVESRLNALPGVREAVVVAREEADGTRMIAYLLAPAPPVEELRRGLRDRLLDAMVPSVFVEVADWPLTPTGKVDRAALPEPSLEEAGGEGGPLTPEQELVAALFAEVLGLPASGPGAEFFALGGD